MLDNFTSDLTTLVISIRDFIWGLPLLLLLLLTGIYLTIGLRFLTIRHIGRAFGLLFRGRQSQQDGDIVPFKALMTSLSATIGTGNIAGVATALVMGGPGALFWMCVAALFGMGTKYAEAVMAVRFRERDDLGGYSGGPMYYLRNGLDGRFRKLGIVLAFAFALFGALAGFGLANTVQSNTVAETLFAQAGIAKEFTGIGLMVVVGLVILGGIKRIADTAGAVVPTMAIGYVVACIIVIAANITEVPQALLTIVESAFNFESAAGGLAGAAIWVAIQAGITRGIFSNEAGLGSAPIAHAAARTNQPVEQGLIAMLGTFIDTIIICTMTGLVIVLTGALETGKDGAVLTSAAFGSGFAEASKQFLPFVDAELGNAVGQGFVSLAVVVFATTTMMGWAFYGERCVVYLIGTRGILPFRVLWVLAIPLGAIADLKIIWAIADILNGLMALPNLVGLLLLSPLVFMLSRDYFSRS